MAADRPPLIEFLLVLGVALYRKKITAQEGGLALLIALTSRGLTGEDATVDDDQLALEGGITTRSVWRHFGALVKAGWFEQTAMPTRPSRDGGGGRRARYRLTPPLLNLSDDDRLTPASASTSDDEPGSSRSSDTLAPDRLTLWGESSDTAEREIVTVLASDGYASDGHVLSRPKSEAKARASEVDEDHPGKNLMHFVADTIWVNEPKVDGLYRHKFISDQGDFPRCELCANFDGHDLHQRPGLRAS